MPDLQQKLLLSWHHYPEILCLSTVYFFWLKPDADRAYFLSELKKLGEIGLVKAIRTGEKVSSHRDVVDSTYDYSLILFFDNQADQDAYQVDADHHVFVNNCSNLWTRVQVYDSTEV